MQQNAQEYTEGKIIRGVGGFYYVHDCVSKVYQCRAKGIFRKLGIKPLVGDRVEIQVLSEEDREGNLERILPRTSSLIRPAVANVDQALVVFAAAKPEPNRNLLDRFLVMMERRNLPVILCFNKKELADKDKVEKLRSDYEKAGYTVCFISIYEEEGISRVKDLLRGKTTVLAGPSGVGKSSLTNYLQPEAAMETGSLSKKIERGKNTTRHSELFFVEKDTFLCDTPGFSSLYTDNMEPEELKECFPEFREFEESCRFIGCAHFGEPRCGVKEAVLSGKLSGERYENYRLIYQELKEKRRY